MPRIPNIPPMFPRPPAPPNIEISHDIRSLRRSARAMEYTNDAELELRELIKKCYLDYDIITQIRKEIESYFTYDICPDSFLNLSDIHLVDDFTSELKKFINRNGTQATIFSSITEELLAEFREEFVWNWISRVVKVRENFIRKYKDRLNWRLVFLHQDELSDELLLEFRDKADPLNMSHRLKVLIEKEIREAGKVEQSKQNRIKNNNAIGWLSVD